MKETPEERRERRMKAKLLARKTRQRELFEAINGVDSGGEGGACVLSRELMLF